MAPAARCGRRFRSGWTEQSSLGCENLPPVMFSSRPASWSATPIENWTSSASATTSSLLIQARPVGSSRVEHPDHRGFPGAASEKAIDLAGSDVEIDAVDRRGRRRCGEDLPFSRLHGVLMAANLAARGNKASGNRRDAWRADALRSSFPLLWSTSCPDPPSTPSSSTGAPAAASALGSTALEHAGIPMAKHNIWEDLADAAIVPPPTATRRSRPPSSTTSA